MPNNRIYRYPLPIQDRIRISLPNGAEILTVGPPRDGSATLDMWAMVNPDNDPETREFQIVGTGHPIDENTGRYIGTVPSHGGVFIWHVFDATSADRPITVSGTREGTSK
jgi:hypothetical protein